MPVYNPASVTNPLLVSALLTPTAMAWKVLPTSFALGAPFTVQVRCTSTIPMASVPIHFFLDGVDKGTQWTSPLVDPLAPSGGFASFTFPGITTEGIHEIKAQFIGNASFSGSLVTQSFTVQDVVYATQITLNSPPTANQDVAFPVSGVLTYTDLLGVQQPLGGRTVRLTVTNGSTIVDVNLVTDAAGAYGANITSTISGNLNITAAYAGETALGLGASRASRLIGEANILIPAAIVLAAAWYLGKKR